MTTCGDGSHGTDGAQPLPEPDHLALRGRMAPELPTGLMAHSARVVALTERLARRHGANLGPALRAAQGHDLLRALPDAELLARAEARGFEILPVERAQPVLLHGPLGALELGERFRLRDPVVLDAVRYHTTGHPAVGLEAWAVFVADKVEPKKLAAWPELQGVLDLRRALLEAAALAYLELTAERARVEGWTIHPLAEETRLALAAIRPVQRLPQAAGPAARVAGASGGLPNGRGRRTHQRMALNRPNGRRRHQPPDPPSRGRR